jgi:hypothetical protein
MSAINATEGSAATGPVSRRRELNEPLGRQVTLTCFVLFLGAIEGWFKRTDFATDAISYLDISRAIPARDWKMVFNPLWSVGYPLLLAAARPFFPSSANGEWLAIHVLNLIIFLGTWLAFLYLLKSFDSFSEDLPLEEALQRRRFVHYAGVCIFIAIQLCIDSVSRVGPDLLVTTFFFLATATIWRLLRNPNYGRAIVLGVILGAGYWIKGIFLPLSFILLLVTAGAFVWKKQRITPVLIAFLFFAVVAAPYVAGLSWSYGHFTTGESGQLNYAFHVNYLPRWTNWQGGPAGYGTPIHPTHEVLKGPDLFVFGEPYHNTYPPFGNVVYWYEGYRHFWSAKYQAIGIGRDLGYLVKILVGQPIFYAVLFSTLLLLAAAENRRAMLKTALSFWPFYLPALLGILLYVQVHLEDRYLGSFLAILCLLPFVTVVALGGLPSRKTRTQIFAIMTLGAALNYLLVDRDIFSHIAHHYTYAENPQWKLGMGLQRLGLKPGDEVAAIGGPNASCTWAYIAHLRIVAELGGDPFDQRNPHPAPAGAEVQEFWRGSPALQGKILTLFRDAGAVAAVASNKPSDVSIPAGWQRVDGTDTWVYLLH